VKTTIGTGLATELLTRAKKNRDAGGVARKGVEAAVLAASGVRLPTLELLTLHLLFLYSEGDVRPGYFRRAIFNCTRLIAIRYQ
jgi:hypothetical protein